MFITGDLPERGCYYTTIILIQLQVLGGSFAYCGVAFPFFLSSFTHTAFILFSDQ